MPLTKTSFSDIFFLVNGGSSSAVERQIVDLLVEGSIPFFHPEREADAYAAPAFSYDSER